MLCDISTTKNEEIRLGTITPDNWRIFNGLKVKENQQSYVPSNVVILARAFAYREYNSRVYPIYKGDTPIGLLMQRDYKEDDRLLCILEEFMIAEQYQGKGYGKAAISLWLSKIKDEKKYDAIILCYIEGNERARDFYLRMGFKHTGVIDEDEVVMEYNLKDRITTSDNQ
ncbi:MAG: GNAT family N-acetyltransferase [Clostridiaceae bacterium]